MLGRAGTGRSFWILLGVWRPDTIFSRLEKSLIRRLQFPNFDLPNRCRVAVGVGVQTVGTVIIHVGAHDSLPVIGKNLDKVFVNKDAQLNVFAFGKIGACKCAESPSPGESELATLRNLHRQRAGNRSACAPPALCQS